MARFRHARQLQQLRRLDPAAAREAEAWLDVVPAYAASLVVEAMQAALTRLTAPADPDETDGPRNIGESIMAITGQDYKAARRAARQRVMIPTAAEARRALELALRPESLNLRRPNRLQFEKWRR